MSEDQMIDADDAIRNLERAILAFSQLTINPDFALYFRDHCERLLGTQEQLAKSLTTALRVARKAAA